MLKIAFFIKEKTASDVQNNRSIYYILLMDSFCTPDGGYLVA